MSKIPQPLKALWTNEEDVVVAQSPNDASKILQNICGCNGTFGHSHDNGQLWERIDEKHTINLYGIQATAQSWLTAGHQGLLGRLAHVGGYLQITR